MAYEIMRAGEEPGILAAGPPAAYQLADMPFHAQDLLTKRSSRSYPQSQDVLACPTRRSAHRSSLPGGA